MTNTIFPQLLKKLQSDKQTRQAGEYIRDHHETILGDLSNVSALLQELFNSNEDTQAGISQLIEIIIDEARINRENAGKHGQSFLDALEKGIVTSNFTSSQVSLLIGCYARARVDVPEILIDKRLDLIEATRQERSNTPPDLAKMLKKMIKDSKGDIYGVHEVLNEMMVGIPKDAQPALAYELSSLENPESWHLAAFFLLSPQETIRQEVALALLHRIQNGENNADLLRLLPALRNWMRPDDARALLDRVIRESRLKQLTAAKPKPALKINKILVTFPDGVGAQSIALVAKKKIAMLLLKDGYGIKDAFIIDCDNAQQSQQVCASLYDMDAQEISLDMLECLLSHALAEGHKGGHCPAYGLIDIATQFGLEELRPQFLNAERWFELFDDIQELTGRSVQKQARILKQIAPLIDEFPILTSWFEDNTATRDLLGSTTASRQEKKLADYLDTRREYWAIKMLQTAAILKKSPNDDILWRPLALSAHCLLQGRDIRKTPMMVYILDNTIEAFEYTQSPPDDDQDEDFPDLDPGDIFNAIGMTDPSWLDGYLSAMLIAPEMVPPPLWAEHLIECLPPSTEHHILQSYLDLTFMRYNMLNAQMLGGEPCLEIANSSPNGLQPWADGFLEAVDVAKQCWQKRKLTKDDQNTLSLINDISDAKNTTPENVNILENWISTRIQKRS